MIEAILYATPAGDEEVEQAVVVVVAPGATATTGGPSVGGQCVGEDARECAVAVVVVQIIRHVGRNVDYQQIHKPVVVVVGPQCCGADSDIIDRSAHGDFRECPVPVVVEQEAFASAIVRVGAVSDEDIQKAVVIVIRPGSCIEKPQLIRQTAAAHPAEGAIAIIVIEQVVSGGGSAGAGAGQQVEVAVIIIVTPDWAHVIIGLFNGVTLGNPGEGTVAIVSIEEIGTAPIGHQQVEKAVVVEIA